MIKNEASWIQRKNTAFWSHLMLTVRLAMAVDLEQWTDDAEFNVIQGPSHNLQQVFQVIDNSHVRNRVSFHGSANESVQLLQKKCPLLDGLNNTVQFYVQGDMLTFHPARLDVYTLRFCISAALSGMHALKFFLNSTRLSSNMFHSSLMPCTSLVKSF